MVWIVNEQNCAPEPLGAAAQRRRLLNAATVPGAKVEVERLSLAAGARCALEVPAGALGWIAVLQGRVHLTHEPAQHHLGDTHVALLPVGANHTLVTENGAELLYAIVPEAATLDPKLRDTTLEFKAVDWAQEPLLDSKNDKRKRIYVATPKLTGTKAMKAEMIIYPPDTMGSNHHHEGAEHFMYVIKGETTGYSDEVPHRYTAGDLVYHPNGERHFSHTGENGLTFIEFFVPAEYKTVWADDTRICTWLPTGKNVQGGKPSRDIAAHDSLRAGVETPADL
ncbi:MAG: cupin domain-containing protein [Betaproteobacteria bacterium]|nr:cupin domain-containing protein [Betaproteobacteria bacterium]